MGSTIWEPLLAELLRSPLLPKLRRLDLRSANDPEREIPAASKSVAENMTSFWKMSDRLDPRV